jgi:hypothetical protein
MPLKRQSAVYALQRAYYRTRAVLSRLLATYGHYNISSPTVPTGAAEHFDEVWAAGANKVAVEFEYPSRPRLLQWLTVFRPSYDSLSMRRSLPV